MASLFHVIAHISRPFALDGMVPSPFVVRFPACFFIRDNSPFRFGSPCPQGRSTPFHFPFHFRVSHTPRARGVPECHPHSARTATALAGQVRRGSGKPWGYKRSDKELSRLFIWNFRRPYKKMT